MLPVPKRRIILGVGLVVAVLLWWWPGLTGSGQRSEITLLGTTTANEARKSLERRLRESGRSVRWIESVDTWCDLDDVSSALTTPHVLVIVDDLAPCSTSAASIASALVDDGVSGRMILVRWSTANASVDSTEATDILLDGSADRVATERLIGTVGEELPCVWWESCPESGRVITVDEGGLTDIGRERLARLVVAAIS